MLDGWISSASNGASCNWPFLSSVTRSRSESNTQREYANPPRGAVLTCAFPSRDSCRVLPACPTSDLEHVFDSVDHMPTWSEFATAAPSLAADVRALLYQYGPGLGYLATVRPDGGPRVHPVAPVVTDGGLFCFLLTSPKRRDLERDGRYALPPFPPEHDDTEAYLSGRVPPVTDPARHARVAAAANAAPRVDWRLFELDIEV